MAEASVPSAEAAANIKNLLDGSGDAVVPEDLEEDSDDGPIDILGNGKLTKEVITAGFGTRPANGEAVTVTVTTRLAKDGTVVKENEQLSFDLGECEVMTALDLVVALMDEGELALVKTAAAYAYGEKGLDEPNIPGDAALELTVKLESVSSPVEAETAPLEYVLEKSEQRKMRGNWFFSRGEVHSALNSYARAVKLLESQWNAPTSEARATADQVLATLQCNLAACQIQLEAWHAAISACDAALRISPDNVKALYRKAKALSCSGDTREARSSLRAALQLEPGNSAVALLMSELSAKVKGEEETDKGLYTKMLGTAHLHAPAPISSSQSVTSSVKTLLSCITPLRVMALILATSVLLLSIFIVQVDSGVRESVQDVVRLVLNQFGDPVVHSEGNVP